MADPYQIGTLVGAVSAFVLAGASYVKAKASRVEEPPALPSATLVAYDRQVEALRSEVIAAKAEAAAARAEVAAARTEAAKVIGDVQTLRTRVDTQEENVSGLLAREHVEADARGKLRSRVEYLVGLLQGQQSHAQRGHDDD